MQVYEFRQDVDKWILLDGKAQKYLAQQLGVSQPYLNSIIKGKKLCSKVFAYALTKCVSNAKTIDDLFIRKEK